MSDAVRILHVDGNGGSRTGGTGSHGARDGVDAGGGDARAGERNAETEEKAGGRGVDDAGSGTADSPLADVDDRFAVTRVATGAAALSYLTSHTVDCVVSAYELPEQNGVEFLRAIREDHPMVPFVLYTDDGSEAIASEAISAGVTEYVPTGDEADPYAAIAERIDAAVDRTLSRPVGSGDDGKTTAFLRTLHEVTTDRDLELEEKIDRLLSLGQTHFDLPFGFLSEIERDDGDGGTQTIVQSTGGHALLEPGTSWPLSFAYCRRTIDGDGLLAFHDAASQGFADDPAYQAMEISTYIGSRLTVEDEMYGTICFGDLEPREREFSDTERMLLRLLTRWTSYELERDRVERQLERQNERLEDFARVVSHDLRNPLNVAHGRLELALDGADDADEHLEEIAVAHERMETLIEDLLELARSGRDLGELTAVDVTEVAGDCAGTVDTESVTIDVESIDEIRADETRVRQLLENLLRNAVDHCPGGVTVTVGGLDDGFYVEDDGPGIPEDDRHTVFEVGYTTAEDGTGFGLAIVQQIAEAHDWSVRVGESDAGGARFEFTDVERP